MLNARSNASHTNFTNSPYNDTILGHFLTINSLVYSDTNYEKGKIDDLTVSASIIHN